MSATRATGPGDFNYASFMAVIAETVQDDEGLLIPAHLMPMGTAVRAAGATKEVLTTNREMAETWTSAVRGEYERQEAERNHVASVADVPELVIGGDNTPAAGPAPREATAAPVSQTLEEELQGRRAFWEARLMSAEEDKGAAVKACAEASAQLLKLEAALDAIRE